MPSLLVIWVVVAYRPNKARAHEVAGLGSHVPRTPHAKCSLLIPTAASGRVLGTACPWLSVTSPVCPWPPMTHDGQPACEKSLERCELYELSTCIDSDAKSQNPCVLAPHDHRTHKGVPGVGHCYLAGSAMERRSNLEAGSSSSNANEASDFRTQASAL